VRQAIIGVLAVALLAATARAANDSADVIVYGGTSGGVIAAVQAGRMGKRVLLVAPEKHLGGMTTGGLGATDMGNQAAIGVFPVPPTVRFPTLTAGTSVSVAGSHPAS